MGTTTSRTALDTGTPGRRVAAVRGLALLAAVMLLLRLGSAARRDTLLDSVRVELGTLAAVGALLAAAAVVTAARSERWTAWLLGGALLLELLLSWMEALVPLVVVPPLVAALVLVLGPVLRREHEPGVDYSRARGVVAVVSVALMAPIALFYTVLGLLVPEWAVPLGWAIYLGLLLVTIRLALRRSWWAAAGPVLALTTWFVGLTVGEQVLGWTA